MPSSGRATKFRAGFKKTAEKIFKNRSSRRFAVRKVWKRQARQSIPAGRSRRYGRCLDICPGVRGGVRDPAPEIVPPFLHCKPMLAITQPAAAARATHRATTIPDWIGCHCRVQKPPRGRESLCDCATTSITPFPDKKGPFTATTAAKTIPSIRPERPMKSGRPRHWPHPWRRSKNEQAAAKRGNIADYMAGDAGQKFYAFHQINQPPRRAFQNAAGNFAKRLAKLCQTETALCDFAGTKRGRTGPSDCSMRSATAMRTGMSQPPTR